MRRIKQVLLVIAMLVLVTIVYLLFWPVPIMPAAWTPPAAARLPRQYQQNSKLATTQRLSLGEGFAPEDVALDSVGRIYAGFDDGRIIRLTADGTNPQIFANTGGRPLGLIFDGSGNLIIADAIKGLLS